MRSSPNSEGEWSRRTYPLMVTLHVGVIASVVFEGSTRPRGRWLALLAAVQPLRLWVLALLGDRWNTRGAVPQRFVPERRGPYAVIRHPNYLVVAIELLALPMAFRLPRVAFAAALANALLLTIRIRDEERLLMAVPEYAAHFARRPRFIPGVF
jgi:methyltransferase